jgi:uncharacterized membrane protein YphA (DoxX/SURF4 family)
MFYGFMSSEIEFPWVLLFVRTVLAVIMVYYGWPKMRNLRSNANDFRANGVQAGTFLGNTDCGS